MSHDHNHHDHHDHGHHHHHHGTSNIRVAFFLNLVFTIIEIFGGLYTNSVAILSDALHDLGDSVALGLAWYFEKLSGKKRDRSFSYGYGRFSLLGALINGIILLAGSVYILSETIPRLLDPVNPDAQGMIYFAIAGILFNGAAVFRLRKGKGMNEKMVMLHLLEDVLGWIAVLIASVVMLLTNLPILDPILSMAIMCFILYNVIRNLRKSLKIFLQGIPDHIKPEAIKKEVLKIDAVLDLHDLHIWTLDGQYHVMTLHLVVGNDTDQATIQSIKQKVRLILTDMGIPHATLEVETEAEACVFLDC